MVGTLHSTHMLNRTLILSFPVDEQNREYSFFIPGNACNQMEQYRGIFPTGKRKTNRRKCIKYPLNTPDGRTQNVLADPDFFCNKVFVHIAPLSPSIVIVFKNGINVCMISFRHQHSTEVSLWSYTYHEIFSPIQPEMHHSQYSTYR